MVDLTPVSFLGQGGLAALPDPFAEMQAATQARQQQQGNAQALQLGQMKIDAVTQQKQQAGQYQADVQEAIRTGRFGALYAKYPEQQKALQAAHDALDEPARKAQQRDLFAVRSYITNGSPELAAKVLQQRIDADREAGQDTADDQQMLDAINSGDPKQVKAAADLALYAILPEDKRAEVFGKDHAKGFSQLGSGGIFNQDTGEVVREPYIAPEYRSVAPGETLLEVGGNGSGSAASPASGRYTGGWTPRERNGGDNPDAAVDNKIAGMAKALGVDPDADISKLSPLTIAQALSFGEGGAGTLADRNNNPTNLRDAKTGDYRKFGSADAALKAAASQVRRNLSRNQTTVRTMIEGLPVGGGSGTRVVAQGGAKPGYTILSPQQKQALGLPADVTYQQSPEGKVEVVSGQDTRTRGGRPIPDGLSKRVEGEVDQLVGLQTAIHGFQDAYGGHTVTGDLSNTAQGIYSGAAAPGQRDWWANFRQTDNVIRNGLFGSALTAQEKSAYEATSITPRMDPAEIRKNLGRRASIIGAALKRRRGSMLANKYDPEAVDALLDTGDSAPASTGGFKILRVRPK